MKVGDLVLIIGGAYNEVGMYKTFGVKGKIALLLEKEYYLNGDGWNVLVGTKRMVCFPNAMEILNNADGSDVQQSRAAEFTIEHEERM
tara:strand:- start:49 stop:312 length:264 start_codon:yes stop_codon:yes gene_type:complete